MTPESERDESGIPKLTLFVAGAAPRSQRARANLSKALEAMGMEHIQPMEVDLLEKPSATITYSVFATPALLRTGDRGEVSVMYGDLSEESKLRSFLDDFSR